MTLKCNTENYTPTDWVQIMYSVTTAECRSYLSITRGIYNIPNIRICIRIRESSCTDIRICIRIRGSPSFNICMCIRFLGSSCADIRMCIRIGGSRIFGIRYISTVQRHRQLYAYIQGLSDHTFPTASPSAVCVHAGAERSHVPHSVAVSCMRTCRGWAITRSLQRRRQLYMRTCRGWAITRSLQRRRQQLKLRFPSKYLSHANDGYCASNGLPAEE